MQIAVEIPAHISERLEQSESTLPHLGLKVIVADAYRTGKITTAELVQTLDLSTRLATHQFFKRMGTSLNYDKAELEQDLRTLENLRK